MSAYTWVAHPAGETCYRPPQAAPVGHIYEIDFETGRWAAVGVTFAERGHDDLGDFRGKLAARAAVEGRWDEKVAERVEDVLAADAVREQTGRFLGQVEVLGASAARDMNDAVLRTLARAR